MEMNKTNMLKLAALMDKVPPNQFDMDDYGRSDKPIFEARCATACCVLGWATAIPELGLELRAMRGSRIAHVYNKKSGEYFDGTGGALGLTMAQANKLFRDGFDMTAREKAKQIRAMVAK